MGDHLRPPSGQPVMVVPTVIKRQSGTAGFAVVARYSAMLQSFEKCACRTITRGDSQGEAKFRRCLLVPIHFGQRGCQVRVIFRIVGSNSNSRFKLLDG